MSLASKVFVAPAKLWLNWPLWSGLLAMLLLAKHAWILFAPAERAIPANTVAPETAHAERLFGSAASATASALEGIRALGIFAHRDAGFAVMQTAQGQVGVALGREVLPGIKLVETQADHVILERNGMRHRIALDQPATGGGIAAAPPPATDMLAPEQLQLLQQQSGTRGRY